MIMSRRYSSHALSRNWKRSAPGKPQSDVRAESRKRSFFFRTAIFAPIFFLSVLTFIAPAHSGPQTEASTQVPRHRITSNATQKYQIGGHRQTYQIDDYVLRNLRTEPPTSTWIENEKAFYTDLLKGNTYDVLVVPCQTQLGGIDRAGRAIITYLMYRRLIGTTNLKIAPMPIVHRALGYRSRYYEDKDVYRLANSLGVQRIVWSYAGALPKAENIGGFYPDLKFSLIVQEGSIPFHKGSPSKIRHWESFELDRRELPSLVFESILEDVLDFIGLSEEKSVLKKVGSMMDNALKFIDPSKRKPVMQETASGTSQLELIASPTEMLHTELNDPALQSLYLQFLGILTPNSDTITREYFFVRSLEALSCLESTHPDYTLLKARAYHYLNRRPAVLQILEAPRTNAEKALQEMANGNLTEMSEFVPQITEPLMRLMADIELRDLRVLYFPSENDKYPEELLEVYPGWKFWLERRLRDSDPWHVSDNLSVKYMLDKEFPIAGVSLEDTVQAAMATGEFESRRLEFELLVHEHIKIVLGSDTVMLSEAMGTPAPGFYDYLMLIDAIGESNPHGLVRYYGWIQGKPEVAADLVKAMETVYKDHPEFTAMIAHFQNVRRKKLKNPERQMVINDAYERALSALWWCGGQERISHSAIPCVRKLKGRVKPARPSFLLYNSEKAVYKLDYPPRADYACQNKKNLARDLNWAHALFPAVKKLQNQHLEKREFDQTRAVLEKYSHRFHGHPDQLWLEALQAACEGNEQKAAEIYSKEIAEGNTTWTAYWALGRHYIRQGQYEKAGALFLSYPRIQPESEYNAVGQSSYAELGGSQLFWRGAYQQAIPLYEISAGLQTGSGSSLASEARLYMLKGDWAASAKTFLQNARRYNYPPAYRDYMSLLHLIGQDEPSWAVFNSLLGRYRTPEIWTAASVGHRILQTDTQKIGRWLKNINGIHHRSRKLNYPSRYAVLCMIDRPPNRELAALADELDDRSGYNVVRSGYLSGSNGELLGHLDTEKMVAFYKSRKETPSFYGSFAQAYVALQQKQYQKAFDRLQARSIYYSYTTKYFGSCLLSYYIWAAVKSGNTDQAKLTLAEAEKEQNPLNSEFNLKLGEAAHAGGLGNHDEAISHLKRAFGVRPHTRLRPIYPWYQIVEMCEWLYEDSGNQQYLDLALKWSREYQIIQPMFAWAYAVEAKYSKNPDERRRALRYALYLDRQSARLQGIPETEKAAAETWLRKNNLFAPKLSNEAKLRMGT